MSDEQQDAADVGSVGEEAAKLLAALSGWAREHGGPYADAASGAASSFADAAHEVNEHIATGSADCRYCPVCRGIHAVRQLSPEVRAHLLSAVTSLAQAAAAFSASLSDPPRPAEHDVERIRLEGD